MRDCWRSSVGEKVYVIEEEVCGVLEEKVCEIIGEEVCEIIGEEVHDISLLLCTLANQMRH